MRIWIVCVVSVLGCYAPEIPSGKFACIQDADCPEPLVCRPTSRGMRCVESGPPPQGPCRGDGVRLGPQVWACRGAFSIGQAHRLCAASGWRVCRGSDESKLSLGAACNSLRGFFAARILVEKVEDMGSMSYSIDCQVDNIVENPWGLIGCGVEMGVRPIGMRRGGCVPLPHALQCRATDHWTCSFGSLDTVSYDGETEGGVLCCQE